MDSELFNTLTLKRHGTPEPLHETVAVLSYEVGRMMEQAMLNHWSGDNDPGHIEWLKSELIDAIAQCQIICESLGCDFEEMRQMGIEKAMERFTGEEVKK